MPRKHDDSGFLGKAPHEVPRNTVSHWNRYLARDPPSYDSGTLLSKADPECALATFPDCDELVASDNGIPLS